MAIETITHFYYATQRGPTRNGQANSKPAIRPNLKGTEGVKELREMAERVTTWGEYRFANDHGSLEDHQMLVNFVNLAVKLAAW